MLVGLGETGAQALRRLKGESGFRFRYSMLNFVELASHLADPPSEKTHDPFRKYQTAFRHIHTLFSGVLPSAESILMQGVGLQDHTGKNWIVDGPLIAYQVKTIAQAESLKDILGAGITPAHYKKLREIDATSFLGVVNKARASIKDPLKDLEAGGKLLGIFYGFLVFRASSGAIRLESLSKEQQLAVIRFFDLAGGKMFLSHFLKLLIRMVGDGANEDPNDFYDMLQLLLLRDENIFFVTDDRPFFQYYVSAEHHRVVPWKGFKSS